MTVFLVCEHCLCVLFTSGKNRMAVKHISNLISYFVIYMTAVVDKMILTDVCTSVRIPLPSCVTVYVERSGYLIMQTMVSAA